MNAMTPVLPAESRAKGMLGITMRRLIIQMLNSYGEKKPVYVQFAGRGAFAAVINTEKLDEKSRKDLLRELGTDTYVKLPALRDLAEFDLESAWAFIGYAIHEGGHVLFTDWKALGAAVEAGRLSPRGLGFKFSNGIEDYRIEGRMLKRYPGVQRNLTALRRRIHPEHLPPYIYDPRVSGPLLLTWTGSILNQIDVPMVRQHLDEIRQKFPPLAALLDDWTARMAGVASTAEAIELAIVFEQEAKDFVEAIKQMLPPPDANQPDSDVKFFDEPGDGPDDDQSDDKSKGEPAPDPSDGSDGPDDDDPFAPPTENAPSDAKPDNSSKPDSTDNKTNKGGASRKNVEFAKAMRKLTKPQRRALFLHRNKRLPIAEIASDLGVDIDEAHRTLRDARRSLANLTRKIP